MKQLLLVAAMGMMMFTVGCSHFGYHGKGHGDKSCCSANKEAHSGCKEGCGDKKGECKDGECGMKDKEGKVKKEEKKDTKKGSKKGSTN